jgi:hypothetical protein
VFASTIQAGVLDTVVDDLDDAAIERSIAEINEAIRRSAAQVLLNRKGCPSVPSRNHDDLPTQRQPRRRPAAPRAHHPRLHHPRRRLGADRVWRHPVLCTASVEEKVPGHKRAAAKAGSRPNTACCPRATHTRSDREAARGKQSGRTQEIQRLIGRSCAPCST